MKENCSSGEQTSNAEQVKQVILCRKDMVTSIDKQRRRSFHAGYLTAQDHAAEVDYNERYEQFCEIASPWLPVCKHSNADPCIADAASLRERGGGMYILPNAKGVVHICSKDEHLRVTRLCMRYQPMHISTHKRHLMSLLYLKEGNKGSRGREKS